MQVAKEPDAQRDWSSGDRQDARDAGVGRIDSHDELDSAPSTYRSTLSVVNAGTGHFPTASGAT
jgi:hypothetical protein